MKNVRVKVRESCGGTLWDYGIYEGRKMLMQYADWYEHKGVAIRWAKAFAKKTGLKFDPKIIKQRGC